MFIGVNMTQLLILRPLWYAHFVRYEFSLPRGPQELLLCEGFHA
jgi:hypothetical protein